MFNIELIKQKLLIYFPSFSVFLNVLKFNKSYSATTGFTNGIDVYYNEDYLNSISSNDQIFLFAHEISHIALNHIERAKDKNMEAWNYATDAVINQMLQKCGLKIPDGCINCPDAQGKTAEEYYEYFINRPDYDEIMSKYRHDKTEEKITSHSNWGQNITPMDKEKLDKLPKYDEREFFETNSNEVKKENENYRENVIKGNSKSSGGSTEEKVIDYGAVGTQNEIINWQNFLKRKKNKIISSGYNYHNEEADEYGIFYVPYEVKRGCKVEILLDTSCSISDELLKGFLREVKNVLGNANVSVACFDTKFYGPFTEINSEDDIDNYEIQGRGATDFQIAVDSFTKSSNLKIIFTDGGASVPTHSNEVIWMVVDNPTFKDPKGVVLHCEESSFVKGRSL